MAKQKPVTPESIIPDVERQQFNSYEDFYKSIPYEGSLGLLALGAAGLLAWRKKKAEIDAQSPKINEEPSNG